MMLTTLDRYLARRFIAMLARTLLSLVVLYILIDLLTNRVNAIGRADAPWGVVARYYLALIPTVVTEYAAPFAVLVSTLLVLGDTAQNNESTAALACGISLRRFVRVPVILALLFACTLFAIQETIGCQAAREAKAIDRAYFSRRPDAGREPVSWANLSGGWRCHIMKFNRLALTGENVLLYAFGDQTHRVVEARRIYWDESRARWMLERGWWKELDANSDALAFTRITRAPAPFTETPEDLFSMEEEPRLKSASRLLIDIQKARERNMPTHALQVSYQAKFAQPALAFVMVGLAIPFGLRLRRGGLAISFGASIAIAITYVIVFFVSSGLGQMGRLDPIAAAWLANGIFLAAGAVLFMRTPT